MSNIRFVDMRSVAGDEVQIALARRENPQRVILMLTKEHISLVMQLTARCYLS